jgi:hypothetical protein
LAAGGYTLGAKVRDLSDVRVEERGACRHTGAGGIGLVEIDVGSFGIAGYAVCWLPVTFSTWDLAFTTF